MASSNYKACLDFTLKWEGGWSNHPKDPGGATMRGVIQRTYDTYRAGKGLPRQSVRNIAESELQEIYRNGYWKTVGGDALAVGTDLAIFDYSVNSGPGRARKAWAVVSRVARPVDQVKAICAGRMAFLRRLRTFSTFGKGWTRRVVSCEALGVRMALAAAGVSGGKAAGELRKESREASGRAATKDKVVKGSGGGAVATGGAGGAGGAASGWDPSMIAFVCVVVAILAFVAFMAWSQMKDEKERADAYAEAANAVEGR